MAQMMELSYTEILNTKINVITMQDAVSYLDENLECLRGKYVCISNVHTTVMAYRDQAYQKIQNDSSLNLPDGKPLSLIQRWRGLSKAGRVPGPDLMPNIFKLSEKRGYRNYFYGSTPETIQALGRQLRKQYPQMKIAGMYSPPFRPLTPEEDEKVIRMINETRPDFIWVGLGAPKQEIWMAEHKDKLCGVMLGVGAGFDFHAGTVRRAPVWLQEICMEWVWRVMQDPGRLLFRYLDTNFSFLYYLMKERHKRRKGQRSRVKKEQNDGRNANRKRNAQNTRGLKIAMIGHKRIPSREGGIEIVVDELSTRMVKLGHQVDAYNRSGYHVSGKAFDEKRGKIYEGVRLITIPTFRNSNLNAIVYTVLGTIRLLFGNYDVIHYHAEGPCSMLWLPRLLGKRVVATIHGLDWQRSKWGAFATKFLLFGERMAAKYADEVIVLSENVQRYFLETYGRETHFISNGISRPEKKDAQEITKRFGLEKDGYILFLARIVPEKGVHYLLEAYARIKSEKKLVIAGGVSHSKEYMDKVHALAAQDPRVVMTDFVQGPVLEELCSNAYLFVMPSDVEGMAMSLLEAMSYGNCCLVSDIPENIEVVGEYAVTFHKADVADLREKLETLLADPGSVGQYREKSADYICGRYHWDQVVQQTLEVYRR